MLLPEMIRNQCKPFNFLLSFIFKQDGLFLCQKKKKAQTTLTEGNEDTLHKGLQNVSCAAFTDSSTAADMHNRRTKNIATL